MVISLYFITYARISYLYPDNEIISLCDYPWVHECLDQNPVNTFQKYEQHIITQPQCGKLGTFERLETRDTHS